MLQDDIKFPVLRFTCPGIHRGLCVWHNITSIDVYWFKWFKYQNKGNSLIYKLKITDKKNGCCWCCRMMFLMTMDVKNSNFCCFHNFASYPPNEWNFRFELSWCLNMTIFFIIKGFPKNKKKMKFSMTTDLSKKKKWYFWCFHYFAYVLFIKWVKF